MQNTTNILSVSGRFDRAHELQAAAKAKHMLMHLRLSLVRSFLVKHACRTLPSSNLCFFLLAYERTMRRIKMKTSKPTKVTITVHSAYTQRRSTAQRMKQTAKTTFIKVFITSYSHYAPHFLAICTAYTHASEAWDPNWKGMKSRYQSPGTAQTHIKKMKNGRFSKRATSNSSTTTIKSERKNSANMVWRWRTVRWPAVTSHFLSTWVRRVICLGRN